MESSGGTSSDFNLQLGKAWDKCLSSKQASAAEFIKSSQKKNLDGTSLFAFFNEKLVSFFLPLILCNRILTASLWPQEMGTPCLL